ncbi:MAG: VWA domain-containing protein [Deltaproteobacteria bacterium]|nr:MAG: VWA domain-containing protein [Deltaproteobacteria bacterium]
MNGARRRSGLALLMAAVLTVGAAGTAVAGRKTTKRPLVQVALLLDTSNSMDGLINQARNELWKVVNELLKARRHGFRPRIQVALYEYGKSSLPKKTGYIRKIVPLTDDLDRVSEELFALGTNGGSEHCGQVIDRAVRELEWSRDAGTLKVIFIAGNEPFTQGPVDYRKAAKLAASRGIVVNTIHCGSEREGINGKWKEGAMLADGRYMFIDQNRRPPAIAAPQDAEIARLSQQLSSTYVPIGTAGVKKKARRAKMARKVAAAAPAAAAERAVFQASAGYQDASWDLVEAEQSGRTKLEDVREELLPPEMRRMSKAERRAYLDRMKKRRAELKAKIKKLNAERQAYIAKKRREQAEKGPKTLGDALVEAIREQAARKNFRFGTDR